MANRRVVVVGVLIAAVVGGVWWYRHRDRPTEDAATTASTGSSATVARAGVPAYREPAHLVVTVTDAHGALADAAVRLAGPEGDVVVVKTGADGRARSEVAPGKWRIGASAVDHEPAAAPARELHAGETAQIALRLEPGGRTLAGTVTDATGGPVAGARIDAARVDGVAKPSDAVATAMTGTDGHYKLSVAAGQLLVAASHADYAPQSRYIEVGTAGATASFQLVPGGVIEGIVRDEQSRQPVAGASITADRDAPAMLLGETARRHATAGPDGRFRIAGLRPGSYALGAQAQSTYSHAPTIVGLGVAEQIADVEILVGKGASIRGTVVDEAGAPVAGVNVSTFGEPDRETEQPSDAKGAFVLAGLEPGHIDLMGGGNDYLAAGMTHVEVTTTDVDGVKVKVRRGGKVAGHVEPRQICEVRLDFDEAALGPAELPILVAPLTTGPDGVFAFESASPIPYVLAARCPSGDQGTQPVRITPDMAELVLPVKAGASIAGRVVDGSGKPVAAAIVMATPMTGSERTTIMNGVILGGAQARSAADGAFELRGLTAATYRLRVLDHSRPVPMKSPEAAARIVLAETDHKTGVELAIDRPDGAIRGTVTGADGQPIADAWVSVQQGLDDMLAGLSDQDHEGESRTVRIESRSDDDGAGAIAPVLTDATGHFEIADLPRVSWTVIAEAQAGKLRGRAVHVTPDATITIQAASITDLHGTIHVVGDPPATFDVTLEGAARAERTFAWQDGTFSFGRVDPGVYTVHVMSSAGNGEAAVTVAAGQSASADITLAANAIVIGKVTDASGKPLGGIGMATVPDGGGPSVSISLSGPPPMTQPDGTFRLETKAGPLIVLAMVSPRPVMKRDVVAQAGKTVDAGTLVVPAAGSGNSGPPPPP